MVRAWFMDNDSTTDQREPHQQDPHREVDLDELKAIGVLYFKIQSDDVEKDELLQKIKQERGYTYEDSITITRDKLPNYEERIKTFYQEHLHSDEEIRLCADGSGYFDVRDRAENWIRIELVKGDMIILPAGIYHRFTLDMNNFITARRYFIGEPVWKAFDRPADEHPARQSYLATLESA